MSRTQDVIGLVKAEGSKLVNGDGREVLLRGVGFGSWLLPEGYMWRFPSQGDRPRRIERMIRELIGPDKATEFWETYYDVYINEADIERIAAEGFNSVRLPINARFLIEEEDGKPVRYHEGHLRLLDRMIRWCEKHRLYAVLDLHGAPGGQTGTNIDDSERDEPELFMREECRKQTVKLWRMLADRYKEEWIVAGYDLLNEPLPNWNAKYNDLVMPLYKEIIAAIREVDPRHMIILEGVHWATDWSIFTEKLDDNLMLQFHKYWNNPDTASIQAFLDKREEWNVPIYMGEGGENNKDWYAGAFRLFEDLDISWNFWTWKKLDTTNSPCSARLPPGWPKLVGYLEGGEKPSAAEAERILWEYLHNLKLENCDYHVEVVNSLLRRPTVRIPAIFYGYRGKDVSFHTVDEKPPIGFRDADGTDIRFIEHTEEPRTPNFQHGGGEEWKPEERLCLGMEVGEWFRYDFYSPVDQILQVELRLKTDRPGNTMTLLLDDREIGRIESGAADWTVIQLENVFAAPEGEQQLALFATEGEFLVDWIDIIAVPVG